MSGGATAAAPSVADVTATIRAKEIDCPRVGAQFDALAAHGRRPGIVGLLAEGRGHDNPCVSQAAAKAQAKLGIQPSEIAAFLMRGWGAQPGFAAGTNSASGLMLSSETAPGGDASANDRAMIPAAGHHLECGLVYEGHRIARGPGSAVEVVIQLRNDTGRTITSYDLGVAIRTRWVAPAGTGAPSIAPPEEPMGANAQWDPATSSWKDQREIDSHKSGLSFTLGTQAVKSAPGLLVPPGGHFEARTSSGTWREGLTANAFTVKIQRCTLGFEPQPPPAALPAPVSESAPQPAR